MLVVDNRPDLAANEGGLHALIVGVSEYPQMPPNLGLEQLASPALSALQFYSWLREGGSNLAAPLGTVRLLLSPSQQEQAADPAGFAGAFGLGAAGSDYNTVRQAVNDWRIDMRRRVNALGLFFFSGHGIGGVGDDALMLLSDFGDPAVSFAERMLSLSDLLSGMATPPAGLTTIGRNQVYFIDACRNRVQGVDNDTSRIPTIWNTIDVPGADTRHKAVFLATISTRTAFQTKAGQPTLFSQSLLECLKGAAAEARDQGGGPIIWQVTTGQIVDHLQDRMDEYAGQLGGRQEFRQVGETANVPLITYTQPPRVLVTLRVTSAEPSANVAVQVRDADNILTLNDPVPNIPVPREFPMGYHRICACAVTPPPHHVSPEQKYIFRHPRHNVNLNF